MLCGTGNIEKHGPDANTTIESDINGKPLRGEVEHPDGTKPVIPPINHWSSDAKNIDDGTLRLSFSKTLRHAKVVTRVEPS